MTFSAARPQEVEEDRLGEDASIDEVLTIGRTNEALYPSILLRTEQ